MKTGAVPGRCTTFLNSLAIQGRVIHALLHLHGCARLFRHLFLLSRFERRGQ